jgi:hypothetical protein
VIIQAVSPALIAEKGTCWGLAGADAGIGTAAWGCITTTG